MIDLFFVGLGSEERQLKGPETFLPRQARLIDEYDHCKSLVFPPISALFDEDDNWRGVGR